jgi:hypothetical protein
MADMPFPKVPRTPLLVIAGRGPRPELLNRMDRRTLARFSVLIRQGDQTVGTSAAYVLRPTDVEDLMEPYSCDQPSSIDRTGVQRRSHKS